MENMTAKTNYWVGMDFWENIRADIAFIRSEHTLSVTKEVVFKYSSSLKEEQYWECVYEQLGKVKFICMKALLFEMQSLIEFDRQLKRDDPKLLMKFWNYFSQFWRLKMQSYHQKISKENQRGSFFPADIQIVS